MPTFNQLGLHKVRTGKIRAIRLKALEGSPQRYGVVYKVTIMTPRKPNSAKRKIVKVRLTFNRRKVFANIPGLGHNLREYSRCYVEGGAAKDLPGVNYTAIRGREDFAKEERIQRHHKRSKYGISKPK